MRGLVGLVVVAALSSMGCAAVFKGSKETVHITSVPEQADVRVNGQYAGPTPAQTEVSRNGSQNIVVSKEGYKDQYVSVQRHADTPWWISARRDPAPPRSTRHRRFT